MKATICVMCGSQTRFVYKVNEQNFCSAGCLHHKYDESEFRNLISKGEATVVNEYVIGDDGHCFVTKDLYEVYERVRKSYIK